MNTIIRCLALSLLTLASFSFRALAAVPLCGFESKADLARIRWASQGQSQLERVTLFATSGQSSLRFSSPTWKRGMPEWPAFEFPPLVQDWTPFDRLIVDLTNPNADHPFLALFVSDDKVPFRQGLRFTFELPARGFRRFSIPLSTLPKSVNRSRIAILHFFTQRPATDLTLYLDNLTLLKQGETAPEPGSVYWRQLARLKLEETAAVEKDLAQSRAGLSQAGGSALLAQLDRQLASIRARLSAPVNALADFEAITAELAGLKQQAGRLASVLRFQQASRALGQPAANLLVGFATSMEKILPRDARFELKPARAIELSLARNEKESFQVAVMPVHTALKQVAVRLTDLRSASGAVLPKQQIDADVVGYVQTKKKPPYDVTHVGWWPDPILNFLGPVDVAVGDVQTFWMRVRAPQDQAPGVYQGQLTVSAAGTAPQTFPLQVRVHAFALPNRSPLPLAITFSPMDHPTADSKAQQAKWRKSPDYPINAWKKHKLRWADFLADYYITYDSLYHQGQPDFEVLAHLHQEGRLGAFNLGYYGPVGTGPNAVADWKQKNLPRFRTAYARAKELGLLDHAYIYGCDEAKAKYFPGVEQAAAILRKAFPGVMVMTTTYDNSYGLDSVIKSMDAFCPLSPRLDPARAAQARAAGKQVWWYICCGPHHPFANMFIEYPAIEGRLLMGAMTARQQPDGFLYYQISIWNSEKPITTGPFTDWNPRSWTSYHGDGSWTCVGPDGLPLPTIRLENFRDGLEDYAYTVMLKEIIRRYEARSDRLTEHEQQWLARAKAALPVPTALLKTISDYARKPAALYAWRNALADLIDASGQADVNPWGDPFGVRGGRTASRSAAKTSPSSFKNSQPVQLLAHQRADGEFPGWKSFHEKPGTRTGDVWRLQPDGVLVCKGQPRGYLYTEQDYTDFVLQFDWRYPRGATQSNGGALVRMTGEHAIWPKCLEFQLNMNQAGDFWAIRGYRFSGPAASVEVVPNSPYGTLRHLKRRADAEKPVGAWNHFKGTVAGDTVTQEINGELVNQATGCDVVPGKILLTAEGQEIHFRNIRLTPRR